MIACAKQEGIDRSNQACMDLLTGEQEEQAKKGTARAKKQRKASRQAAAAPLKALAAARAAGNTQAVEAGSISTEHSNTYTSP